MKVVCIESSGQVFIRVGFLYEVIKIDLYTDKLIVLNDGGDYFAYPRRFFMTLSEYRKKKLEKLDIVFNSNGV